MINQKRKLPMTIPRWLEWAERLQTASQAGLTYSKNPFDLDRYQQIKEITAEILAEYSDTPMPVMRDLLSKEYGYPTPKIDCRGVVFKGDHVLMVKELSDGGWTFPGGWVDLNEPPSRAVEREVFEESGYVVKAVKILGIYDRNQHGFPAYVHHIYKLFVLCELIGGEATTSDETGAVDWFPEGAIPPLSLLRTTPEVIQRMFEHHRNPDLPTDFD
jgi:ADP-ribose pyrophosphatase YjhB (NUDIX family)